MHNLIIQLLGQAKEIASSSYEHLFFMSNNVVMANHIIFGFWDCAQVLNQWAI
jgi:hypothetical protein